MTKYLFPILTAVGTSVLGAVDACWAAIGFPSPNRRRAGQQHTADNEGNRPLADAPSHAPGALLTGLSVPRADMSQKNA
jgi:hypothetical protein